MDFAPPFFEIVFLAGLRTRAYRCRRERGRLATIVRWKHFLSPPEIVALAEMGDKTQLLALVLAARYRKPRPVACGILVATAANHALAGDVDTWVSTALGPDSLRWLLGLSSIAMAA